MRHSIKRMTLKVAVRMVAVLMLAAMAPAVRAADPAATARKNIAKGNEMFQKKEFAAAEVLYKKALAAQPSNATAQFNLALSLLRQKGALKPDSKDFGEIAKSLTQLTEDKSKPAIARGSALTLGNMYYRAEDYQQAIEQYKRALRLDPDYDIARENLRLAQKKLQDKDKNKDKDKDKDKNQDQDKNQNQNKDQNKDRNKDRNQNQQPQPQQQQLSDANAERILKEMQNREAATLKRLQEQQQTLPRKQVTHPW